MLARLLLSEPCFLFLRQQLKTNASITTPNADPIVAPATVAFDEEGLFSSCVLLDTDVLEAGWSDAEEDNWLET